jgi:hypothetical protein
VCTGFYGARAAASALGGLAPGEGGLGAAGGVGRRSSILASPCAGRAAGQALLVSGWRVRCLSLRALLRRFSGRLR